MSSNKNVITTKLLYFRAFNAVDKLEGFLDELSNGSIDSTTTVFQRYELLAMGVIFTLPMLNLLVHVLTQTLPKAPNSNGSTRWDSVDFSRCSFGIQRKSHPEEADDDFFCSRDSIQIFASALAHGTSSLTLNASPEILKCLFKTPKLDFQVLALHGYFSAVERARLGELLQRCVPLRDLYINASHWEEPHLLGECLTNAFHLQSVAVKYYLKRPNSRVLGKFINSARQLLSLESRLKELSLPFSNLKDHHFLSLVEMLSTSQPTSQLQVLNLWRNAIGHEGILAFARQLPNIKYLKKIVLADNPWERDEHYRPQNGWGEARYSHDPSASYQGCITALLEGMLENDSIECLELCRSDKQLEYCTRTNWIRGQVSGGTSLDSIPVGLWPLILARVGSRTWQPVPDGDLRFQKYSTTNILYFVLQNSPILQSAPQRTVSSLRRSKRKRKSVDRYQP